jgi:hypothetical protein
MKFQDIEHAFMFVSMAPKFANSAILSKETGEIYYVSEFGDSDELPDDVDDIFTIMTGSKMFIATIGGVKEYLEATMLR